MDGPDDNLARLIKSAYYACIVTNTYRAMEKVETFRLSSIYSPNGGTEALFDWENDPGELHNLSDVEDRDIQQAKRELRSELVRMFKKDGFQEVLNPQGDDLLSVPLSPVPAPRNRQYSNYDPSRYLPR